MARDVIATCPVCQDELAITRLHCRTCGTTLEGEFSVGRYGHLNREQVTILESFLRSRGNLKDMERDLGISYPTVRGRLDALVRALGLADGEGTDAPAEPPEVSEETPTDRRTILERLAKREISAEDAATALRKLGVGA